MQIAPYTWLILRPRPIGVRYLLVLHSISLTIMDLVEVLKG